MLTDPNLTGVELPSIELLQKFDVPAPRYTSYPTADRFNKNFTTDDYEEALANRETDKPLSLYVHIPFCNDICFYCGCNKQVTRDHSKSAEYLDVLDKEIELVKGKSAARQRLANFTSVEARPPSSIMRKLNG